MYGLPSHFATEQDIKNCIPVDPAGTKKKLQELLDGRMGWVKVADLAPGDAGITDALHCVRVEPVDPDADLMDPDAPVKNVQYQLQDDPLTPLFRLGLTVAKVQSYIAECDSKI